MKNVYELFLKGTKAKKGLGEFGIEIETETKSANYYPKDFFGESIVKESPGHGQKIFWHPRTMPEWSVTEDGSLRDFGREFVLKEPLDYSLAMMSLDSFGQATKDIRFTLDAPATSVHVHMNITKFTCIQLINLISLIMFFENLLTEFCGESRRSNTFARPCRCADATVENVYKMIEAINSGAKKPIMFSQSNVKYGVMNLSTLSIYGSLEIRCMRGTTNPEEIKDWLTILNRLYKYAQLPGLTPFTFYEMYKDIEFEVVDRIFGSDSDRLKCKYWRDMLRRNEFWLSNIATLIPTWSNFGSKYTEEPETVRAPKIALGGISPGQLAQIYSNPPQPIEEWSPVDPNWTPPYFEEED